MLGMLAGCLLAHRSPSVSFNVALQCSQTGVLHSLILPMRTQWYFTWFLKLTAAACRISIGESDATSCAQVQTAVNC